MTNLLVRIFIKNPEQTDDIQVRTAYGVLAGGAGIFCNICLFTLKLLCGIFIGSMSVLADAFNNLSDAVSSILSLVGMKIAGKPADKDHPFGHGRMEYIAAMIVAFLVIEVGINLFRESIGKIRNPEAISFSPVITILLICSILVKLWMAYFNNTLGKRIDSQVMQAVKLDSLTDVIATSGTIAAILVFAFTGHNIDGIVGLLISILIIWEGIQIVRDTLEPLLGNEIDPALEQTIRQTIEKHDGIMGTHDLIVHNYGPGRSMASVHVEVPREASVEEAHEIIDHVEKEVLRRTGIYIVAHTDPVEIHDARILELKKKVDRIITLLDEQLEFHDFQAYLTSDPEEIHATFDLKVPYSYDDAAIKKTTYQIEQFLKELDSCYSCKITVDRGFFSETN